MWRIWGKYSNLPAELIDEFDTEDEALRMLTEYRMAFGQGWLLWLKEPVAIRWGLRKVVSQGETK